MAVVLVAFLARNRCRCGFRPSHPLSGGGGYAVIAAIRGWMPIMFMTRVRL
jgi:hypothetical protein